MSVHGASGAVLDSRQCRAEGRLSLTFVTSLPLLQLMNPSWGKGRRGWTSKGGQANFPPLRPGGLCQDRPNTVRTMGYHVHFPADRSHSRAPACYMTKGGPIKRSGRPLLKLSLCPALSPAFEEGGSERPAWGQEVHRLRSQTVATFPTAAAVPSPRVKSSGRALDGKVGTLNHHRCNQRRLFFSPKDMTRQSLHYTDRGLRPGKESDLCVYTYSACPLGACSLEAGIGVQGTDDHLDQCCQKFTQG